MPFDPALPLDGANVKAFVLRGQFTALNDKIDAIPAGPPGADGAQGPAGNDGAQGPPFASAVVDSVDTLEPDEPATVDTTFDGSTVHFTIAIPRGAIGPAGPQGDSGPSGGDGPPGPPGDVNMDQLASAIAGTSSNTNAVAALDDPFTNDPPTLADIELLRAKINELITALRR